MSSEAQQAGAHQHLLQSTQGVRPLQCPGRAAITEALLPKRWPRAMRPGG